jgi:hypothetical protein
MWSSGGQYVNAFFQFRSLFSLKSQRLVSPLVDGRQAYVYKDHMISILMGSKIKVRKQAGS